MILLRHNKIPNPLAAENIVQACIKDLNLSDKTSAVDIYYIILLLCRLY